jgi:hypothetical protein
MPCGAAKSTTTKQIGISGEHSEQTIADFYPPAWCCGHMVYDDVVQRKGTWFGALRRQRSNFGVVATLIPAPNHFGVHQVAHGVGVVAWDAVQNTHMKTLYYCA